MLAAKLTLRLASSSLSSLPFGGGANHRQLDDLQPLPRAAILAALVERPELATVMRVNGALGAGSSGDSGDGGGETGGAAGEDGPQEEPKRTFLSPDGNDATAADDDTDDKLLSVDGLLRALRRFHAPDPLADDALSSSSSSFSSSSSLSSSTSTTATTTAPATTSAATRRALRRKLLDDGRPRRVERLYAGLKEALLDRALAAGRELPKSVRLGLDKGQRAEALSRHLLLEARKGRGLPQEGGAAACGGIAPCRRALRGRRAQERGRQGLQVPRRRARRGEGVAPRHERQALRECAHQGAQGLRGVFVGVIFFFFFFFGGGGGVLGRRRRSAARR